MFLKGFFEGTELNHLGVDEMFVECGLDIVVSSDDKGVSFVRSQVELYFLPDRPHLAQHCLNVVLFAGFLAYFNTRVDMVKEFKFQN